MDAPAARHVRAGTRRPGLQRPGPRARGAWGAGLLVLGAVCALLYRFESGNEHHAYSGSGVAPSSFRLVEGRQYELSYPGGITALDRRGIQVDTLQCSWSLTGSTQQALTISDTGAGDKPTNVVANFDAPATGDIAISCSGLGAVYVDDAENAGGDPSGWYLLLTTIFLTVGAALGLSALRSATLRPATPPPATPQSTTPTSPESPSPASGPHGWDEPTRADADLSG